MRRPSTRRRSAARRAATAPPALCPRTASRSTRHRCAAGLHLVATPIGNLRDITLRALEVAGRRRPDRLRGHPRHPQAARPLRHRDPAHALPRAQRRRRRGRSCCARLAAGDAVALVSDAGTPLVSDPGYKLVRAAHEAGHMRHRGAGRLGGAGGAGGRRPADRPVLLRGLPAAEGGGSGAARIAELARIPATLVLFETGPRLAAALADLAAGLGRARGRGLPRADQAARGGAARRPRRAGARATPQAPSRAARSSSSSRRRRRETQLERRRDSTRCCAQRSTASR